MLTHTHAFPPSPSRAIWHGTPLQKFDGVLGFSQGAVAASLVCSLRSADAHNAFSSLRFAILISGFPARARALRPAEGDGEGALTLPSLHMWGTSDELVAPAASQRLCARFGSATRAQHVHSKGHMVPSDGASRGAVCDFALSMVRGRAAEGDGDGRL